MQRLIHLYHYTNSVTGKCYIGTTCNLEQREREHRSGRARNSGRALAGAVRKYGFDVFTRRVLAVFDDVDAALLRKYNARATAEAPGNTPT